LTIDELLGEMSSDNYDDSPTASPAERIIREITVHNPYDESSAFNIQAIQESGDYRTYLETTELILAAGESPRPGSSTCRPTVGCPTR